MIGYLDEVIKPVVLLLPWMSRYVKKFKDKSENKGNKLMPLQKNDKLLEKYMNFGLRLKIWKNIKLDALADCNNRYIKIKIRTYGNYTNFHSLNFWVDGIECESFKSRLLIFYLFMRKNIIFKYF